MAKILLIEDESLVRMVTTKMLEQLGHEVVSVSDGRNGCNWISSENGSDFSLVIVDQCMPGLTGQETAKKIHKMRENLPIVMTSGDLDCYLGENANFPDIVDYLPKPYSKAELMEVVKNALICGD